MLMAAASPPERVPASEAPDLSALWRRDLIVELQVKA